MGIGIAIAAVAITATVASDVGFVVAESEKQDELKEAINETRVAIDKANDLYQKVYKVVKSRLEHLTQSMTKLPHDVVKILSDKDLNLGLNDPEKSVQYFGLVLNDSMTAASVVELLSSGLVSAELAASDGVIAEVGAIASDVVPVLAVAGFGLSLYNGITALEKLDHAIEKVKRKRKDAENAVSKMQGSLDGLLKSMKLQVGKYAKLKDISEDWAKLAENFDKKSTAFYRAMTAFATGKSQPQVHQFLKSKGLVDLKDDVLVLAKLFQENILDMMRQGKTDEQVIDFYANENPRDGLRFLLDPFFVSTLRSFIQ